MTLTINFTFNFILNHGSVITIVFKKVQYYDAELKCNGWTHGRTDEEFPLVIYVHATHLLRETSYLYVTIHIRQNKIIFRIV